MSGFTRFCRFQDRFFIELRMVSRLLVGFMAGSLVAASALDAQDALPRVAPRLRIAILDMSGSAFSVQTVVDPNMTATTIPLAPPPDFSRGLTQMLTTALVAHPEFVVLERPRLDKILAEQEIGTTGRLDPKAAAAVGKLLGAQALITGDITEFSHQQSSTKSAVSVLKALDKRVGGKVDRTTAQVAIDLRIMDATTGEILGAVRGEGKASSTGVGVEFTSMEREVGAGTSRQTPLGAASRQAVERGVLALVEHLRRIPWTGRIAEVREDRVYINAGSNLGIQPGMEFGVFAQSESIVDPESGVTLGTPDQPIGRLSIVEVAERYAVGRMVEGEAPKRNDVIRFRGVGKAP